MLLLARQVFEAVVLKLPNGETIRVSVARITPGVVRLAFDAPDDVLILREELVEEPTPCSP